MHVIYGFPLRAMLHINIKTRRTRGGGGGAEFWPSPLPSAADAALAAAVPCDEAFVNALRGRHQATVRALATSRGVNLTESAVRLEGLLEVGTRPVHHW